MAAQLAKPVPRYDPRILVARMRDDEDARLLGRGVLGLALDQLRHEIEQLGSLLRIELPRHLGFSHLDSSPTLEREAEDQSDEHHPRNAG